MLPGCRAVQHLALSLARLRTARACSGDGCISYIQGQSPEPKTWEYFYYVDHQGQPFLDDSKMKNFVTSFKDLQFLVTFFSHLRPNRSRRYETSFPFLSPSGRERNFLSCENRPWSSHTCWPPTAGPPRLSYCSGGETLAVPFEPARLLPWRLSGACTIPCQSAQVAWA